MPGAEHTDTLTTWAKAGLPIDVAMPWNKVDRSTWADCWPWLGTLNSDGYGVFSRRLPDGKPRQYRAHRVAYVDATGHDPGPTGVIDHTCRNRACCNPRHMEVVSLAENARRSVHTLKAVCVRGHERTTDNVRVDKFGRRRGCLECEREDRKARYVRDKAARVGGPGCPGQNTA